MATKVEIIIMVVLPIFMLVIFQLSKKRMQCIPIEKLNTSLKLSKIILILIFIILGFVILMWILEIYTFRIFSLFTILFALYTTLLNILYAKQALKNKEREKILKK